MVKFIVNNELFLKHSISFNGDIKNSVSGSSELVLLLLLLLLLLLRFGAKKCKQL